MSNPAANHVRRHRVLAALVCAAAGAGLFAFYGNASRGWVNTPSLFWWWASQWLDPNADSEHGWLILGLSGWLLWRNVRSAEVPIADCGSRIADSAGDTGYRRPETGERRDDTGNRIPDTGERKPSGGVTPATTARRLETRSGGTATVSGIRYPVSGIARSAIVAPALCALLAGLALHLVGFAAQQARLSILALLLFTWGVLRLGGGRRWGAAAAFPLAFLVFAIPVNVLDTLGFWLRMGVVEASAAIARAAGIPVVQSGTQLFAPDGRYNYDVAAACSGVRSLTAMVALSLLAGYLNFRSAGRRGLILAVSLPLVYVGNVARIVAIIFAAQLGGTRWGDLAHEVMGFGVFAIVLGGVLAAIALLRRCSPEPGGSHLLNDKEVCHLIDDKRVAPLRVIRAARVVAAIVVAAAVGEAGFLHHLANSPPRGRVGIALAADGVNPVELPAFLGTEWIARRTDVTAIEREILPADTGYSRKLYVPMADPNRPVLLSIVLSGSDRTSIHRPELCLVGQGWTIRGGGEHRFRAAQRGAAIPATLLRINRELSTPRGRTTVPALTAYFFIGGDVVAATHWQRVARDGWNRVAHARADRWAYVLLQTDASDGEPAALARMQAVLDGTLPVMLPHLPQDGMSANGD